MLCAQLNDNEDVKQIEVTVFSVICLFLLNCMYAKLQSFLLNISPLSKVLNTSFTDEVWSPCLILVL